MGQSPSKKICDESTFVKEELIQREFGLCLVAHHVEYWETLCVKQVNYEDCLSQFTNYHPVNEYLDMDLPRTFPQVQSSDEIVDLTGHRSKIRNVIGALCNARTNSLKELQYISGMTFIASFILIATDHDEGRSFYLMMHIIPKCPWLNNPSPLVQERIISDIDKMIRYECPRLHEEIERVGIPLIAAYYGNYVTLFTRQKIPTTFTYFCWDKLFGHDHGEIMSIIIVSVFVVSLDKLLNGGEPFQEIIMKPVLWELMIDNLDCGKFIRVYRRLIKRYIGR